MPGSRIQVVIAYALVLVLAVWYLLERTPFGRYLRATGMGRPAARLSGVRTERYLTSSFVLAALLASFAGFLLASRSGSAPPTLGPEFLLPAYAAAFLGAATIRPGFFNVWGTVVGAFLLAVGSNGLTLMGAQTWVANVFNGSRSARSSVRLRDRGPQRGQRPDITEVGVDGWTGPLRGPSICLL